MSEHKQVQAGSAIALLCLLQGCVRCAFTRRVWEEELKSWLPAGHRQELFWPLQTPLGLLHMDLVSLSQPGQ